MKTAQEIVDETLESKTPEKMEELIQKIIDPRPLTPEDIQWAKRTIVEIEAVGGRT